MDADVGETMDLGEVDEPMGRIGHEGRGERLGGWRGRRPGRCRVGYVKRVPALTRRALDQPQHQPAERDTPSFFSVRARARRCVSLTLTVPTS